MIPQPLIEALIILAWIVVFVAALGLAEIAINIIETIVMKVRRMLR